MRLGFSLRTALLLMLGLIAAVFVLLPFFAPGGIFAHSLRAAIEIALVATVWHVARSRGLRAFVVAIALLHEMASRLVQVWPQRGLVLLDLVADVVFVATVGMFIGGTAWRVRRVDAEVLVAAVVVYFLLGYFWAMLYSLLEFTAPGSFANACPVRPGGVLDCVASLGYFPRLLYFSFVTLTTLGYGDVLPVTSQAEGLVAIATVTGQLYVAILIGRLVGDYLSRRRDEGVD